MASPNDFEEVIANIDDAVKNVAIFSHNNGLTHFANELTEKHIEHVPTCGIVGFSIDTDSWADFDKAKKEFLFFYFPKMFG